MSLIGGIGSLIYAAFLIYVAIKQPPKIIALMKKILLKNTTDKTCVIICYVFAAIALTGGILSIVFSST